MNEVLMWGLGIGTAGTAGLAAGRYLLFRRDPTLSQFLLVVLTTACSAAVYVARATAGNGQVAGFILVGCVAAAVLVCRFGYDLAAERVGRWDNEQTYADFTRVLEGIRDGRTVAKIASDLGVPERRVSYYVAVLALAKTAGIPVEVSD